MSLKRVVHGEGPEWPKPIGPAGHEVFRGLCVRLQGVSWFLMGRSLLAYMVMGRLDENDTDIDIAVLSQYETHVREALSDWTVVQETVAERTHQLLYQPDGVLVDVHFFSPIPQHFGYLNLFNKWVTRPAARFADQPSSSSEYGDVRVPFHVNDYLHDDYGPGWRSKYGAKPGWR